MCGKPALSVVQNFNKRQMHWNSLFCRFITTMHKEKGRQRAKKIKKTSPSKTYYCPKTVQKVFIILKREKSKIHPHIKMMPKNSKCKRSGPCLRSKSTTSFRSDRGWRWVGMRWGIQMSASGNSNWSPSAIKNKLKLGPYSNYKDQAPYIIGI